MTHRNARCGRVLWSSIARQIFFGTAMLLIAGPAALADVPVPLICHPNVDNLMEDEPTTIELNDVSNSVIVKMGSAHYSSGGLAGHSLGPVVVLGPLTAVYGADAITFSNSNGHYDGHYTLNRITGILLNTDSNWRWTCQPGKKQF